MALLQTHFDSDVLDLSVGMNVIMPDRIDAWERPPALLYLLHGLSDDYTMWLRRTSIERYAARYPLVVVMPDAYKSFYCNMRYGSQYEKFMLDELPSVVQRFFNVTKDPSQTFIAGLSMGGYGAMKLGLKAPEQFSHVASLSGSLDIASHTADDFKPSRVAAFEAVFGDWKAVPESAYDLMTLLAGLTTPPKTNFYVSCGTDDYLYQDSVNFYKAAQQVPLNLTYAEAPGAHTWGYWDHHIQSVLEWLPIDRFEEK